MSSLLMGCSSNKEAAQRDVLTENVGKYPPAPQGVNRPRVGVPPFNVKAEGGMAGGGLDTLAADQMTTLLDQTERFQVIERAQLEKLLDEQNLEGIVKSDELAKTAQVRGVDYLLLGKVTNLRVKTERNEKGFGLAQVGGEFFNAGGLDIKSKNVKLTTEAGVDIRLVDPTTGALLVSNFSEYKKTDTAGAMGVDILGASANADADIEVSEDDKGKILRLALDDAVRKSLPKIDRFLTNQPAKPASAAPAAAPAAAAAPAVAPAAATGGDAQAGKKFCPSCGAAQQAGAKFCPVDGTKIQ
ncbi:MAG TPA: CsgG/HfaB family protein [Tepidisphaeraceae bacterium]|nr:CsgG/HfaB family protein [Tepidisphaeraceae bacterium]